MNTKLIAIIAAVIVVSGLAMYAFRPAKRESFTVIYPSNEKLKQSWDRSAILTTVLPDGRLR